MNETLTNKKSYRENIFLHTFATEFYFPGCFQLKKAEITPVEPE